jgi:prepilin-type N-terminal cleavage/methylation domain-containing protein
MKRPLQHLPRRSGFTLVELLVAMALTLFVMTILVEAFGSGMDTFQNMRALGEIQDQLRSAMNLVKSDIVQDHFEGSRHLSDVNFWDEPRREGFFYIRQGSPLVMAPNRGGYILEGTDLDGVNKSYLATDHLLHFSVRLRGNRRENFFFDTAGGSLVAPALKGPPTRLSATNQDNEAVYGNDPLGPSGKALTSQWGEIAYFLLSSNAVIPQDENGQPAYGPIKLYNLYRASLLTIPYADEVNKNNIQTLGFKRISRSNPAAGKSTFLSPNDFAKGSNFRSYNWSQPVPSATNDITAAALVCTNVVSFQVRIMKDPPTAGAIGYEDLPSNAQGIGEFDSAVKPSQPYRLTGIQIILRIFDPSTGLTRQATLSQDL